MKTVRRYIAKILFMALVVILLVLNASFGLAFVSKLFPDSWVIQYASLALFDGGALIWFLVFLDYAKGAGQRGTALLSTIIDLVGAFAIAATEIFTAGEQWLSDPTLAGTLRQTAMYVLILWVIMNVIALYLFHATDPKTQQEIELQSQQDEMTAQALEITRNSLTAIAGRVAAQMSQKMEMDSIASLSRETGVQLLGGGSPRPVIDAQFSQPARPAQLPQMQRIPNPNYRKPKNFLERLGQIGKQEPEYIMVPVEPETEHFRAGTPVANIGTSQNGNSGTNQPRRRSVYNGPMRRQPMYTNASETVPPGNVQQPVAPPSLERGQWKSLVSSAGLSQKDAKWAMGMLDSAAEGSLNYTDAVQMVWDRVRNFPQLADNARAGNVPFYVDGSPNP